ncbi:MAG: hypothetical protein ABSB95_01035 [Dissulfurispiraceae bacterium]|jgi:hypothetical protein
MIITYSTECLTDFCTAQKYIGINGIDKSSKSHLGICGVTAVQAPVKNMNEIKPKDLHNGHLYMKVPKGFICFLSLGAEVSNFLVYALRNAGVGCLIWKFGKEITAFLFKAAQCDIKESAPYLTVGGLYFYFITHYNGYVLFPAPFIDKLVTTVILHMPEGGNFSELPGIFKPVTTTPPHATDDMMTLPYLFENREIQLCNMLFNVYQMNGDFNLKLTENDVLNTLREANLFYCPEPIIGDEHLKFMVRQARKCHMRGICKCLKSDPQESGCN